MNWQIQRSCSNSSAFSTWSKLLHSWLDKLLKGAVGHLDTAPSLLQALCWYATGGNELIRYGKVCINRVLFPVMFLTQGSLQSIPHPSQNIERETVSFCLPCESSDLGQPSEKITMYKSKHTCDIMVMEINSSGLCFQTTEKTEQEGNSLPTQTVTTTFHFKLKLPFNLIWKLVSAQHLKTILNRKYWTTAS